MTKEQAERKAAALTEAGTHTYVSHEAGRPGGYRTRSARGHAEANERYDNTVTGQVSKIQRDLRWRSGILSAKLDALEEAR